MKSAKEIIQSIQNDPLYAEIQELQAIRAALPATFQSLVAWIYRREKTLFIACKHPAGKLELSRDNNKKLIKNLLKLYREKNPNSNLAQISDIKIYVSAILMRKTIRERKREAQLREIAAAQKIAQKLVKKAKFEPSKMINHVQDPQIRAIFDEIKGNLLASNQS